MENRSCGTCGVILTKQNSRPAYIRKNVARCRSCHKDKFAFAHALYEKKRYGSFQRRHTRMLLELRDEGTPKSDLLWSRNFYTELVRDNECHYCLGPLSHTGHSLDRIRNEKMHVCGNVVPCCKKCNTIKGKYWEYEHMMLLAPKLRKIRQEKQSAVNA